MTALDDGAALDWDGPLLGLIIKMPAASTVELAGHAGFDLVLIDTEHGPADMTDLEHHIRAADSAGIRSLVRVSHANSPDILRALDAGAHGIVVPHIKSAADVATAAALTHYPPRGRRSLALSTRAGRHGLRSVAEHLEAVNDVMLIGQLEDAEALERMPEILVEEGLAGVFIGPSDLSASLGLPGQTSHPVVADAIERIREAVHEKQGLSLCVLAADEFEAQRGYRQGADLVLLNAPTLLAARLRTIVAAVRTLDGQSASGRP